MGPRRGHAVAANESGLRVRQSLSQLLVRLPNEPALVALAAHRDYLVGEALVSGWAPLSSAPVFPSSTALARQSGGFVSNGLIV
jgi:hypothetical protein